MVLGCMRTKYRVLVLNSMGYEVRERTGGCTLRVHAHHTPHTLYPLLYQRTRGAHIYFRCLSPSTNSSHFSLLGSRIQPCQNPHNAVVQDNTHYHNLGSKSGTKDLA